MGFFKRFEVVTVRPDTETEQVVVRTVRQFSEPSAAIAGHTRLIEDLELISDDLTKILLMLEESFGVCPSRPEYRQVHTVSDLVRLFDRVRKTTAIDSHSEL